MLLLATYPFAVYYSAAYTESLFLLAALGTWFHSRREEFLRAAGWGLLLGLTRPNGFFLAVPLGLIALGVADAEPRRGGGGGGSMPAEPATALDGRGWGHIIPVMSESSSGLSGGGTYAAAP